MSGRPALPAEARKAAEARRDAGAVTGAGSELTRERKAGVLDASARAGAAPKVAVTTLGLDPGTRRFGWGVVRRDGTRLVHVAHGILALADAPLAERLVEIEQGLTDVLRTHTPTHAAVEGLFFHKDAQAAAKLGHARGVALLVCGRAGLEVFEYAPARVKRTVAAHGQAQKHQVAQMVRVILGLAAAPPADAADALAIAITHLQGSQLAALRRR